MEGDASFTPENWTSVPSTGVADPPWGVTACFFFSERLTVFGTRIPPPPQTWNGVVQDWPKLATRLQNLFGVLAKISSLQTMIGPSGQSDWGVGSG